MATPWTADLWANHPCQVDFWQMMKQCRKRGWFCDITLHMRDTTTGATVSFPAHKNVLVCGSRYFRQFMERGQLTDHFILDATEIDCVEYVLDYLYGVTKQIRHASQADNVADLAAKLEIDSYQMQRAYLEDDRAGKDSCQLQRAHVEYNNNAGDSVSEKTRPQATVANVPSSSKQQQQHQLTVTSNSCSSSHQDHHKGIEIQSSSCKNDTNRLIDTCCDKIMRDVDSKTRTVNRNSVGSQTTDCVSDAKSPSEDPPQTSTLSMECKLQEGASSKCSKTSASSYSVECQLQEEGSSKGCSKTSASSCSTECQVQEDCSSKYHSKTSPSPLTDINVTTGRPSDEQRAEMSHTDIVPAYETSELTSEKEVEMSHSDKAPPACQISELKLSSEQGAEMRDMGPACQISDHKVTISGQGDQCATTRQPTDDLELSDNRLNLNRRRDSGDQVQDLDEKNGRGDRIGSPHLNNRDGRERLVSPGDRYCEHDDQGMTSPIMYSDEGNQGRVQRSSTESRHFEKDSMMLSSELGNTDQTNRIMCSTTENSDENYQLDQTASQNMDSSDVTDTLQLHCITEPVTEQLEENMRTRKQLRTNTAVLQSTNLVLPSVGPRSQTDDQLSEDTQSPVVQDTHNPHQNSTQFKSRCPGDEAISEGVSDQQSRSNIKIKLEANSHPLLVGDIEIKVEEKSHHFRHKGIKSEVKHISEEDHVGVSLKVEASSCAGDTPIDLSCSRGSGTTGNTKKQQVELEPSSRASSSHSVAEDAVGDIENTVKSKQAALLKKLPCLAPKAVPSTSSSPAFPNNSAGPPHTLMQKRYIENHQHSGGKSHCEIGVREKVNRPSLMRTINVANLTNAPVTVMSDGCDSVSSDSYPVISSLLGTVINKCSISEVVSGNSVVDQTGKFLTSVDANFILQNTPSSSACSVLTFSTASTSLNSNSGCYQNQAKHLVAKTPCEDSHSSVVKLIGNRRGRPAKNARANYSLMPRHVPILPKPQTPEKQRPEPEERPDPPRWYYLKNTPQTPEHQQAATSDSTSLKSTHCQQPADTSPKDDGGSQDRCRYEVRNNSSDLERDDAFINMNNMVEVADLKPHVNVVTSAESPCGDRSSTACSPENEDMLDESYSASLVTDVIANGNEENDLHNSCSYVYPENVTMVTEQIVEHSAPDKGKVMCHYCGNLYRSSKLLQFHIFRMRRKGDQIHSSSPGDIVILNRSPADYLNVKVKNVTYCDAEVTAMPGKRKRDESHPPPYKVSQELTKEQQGRNLNVREHKQLRNRGGAPVNTLSGSPTTHGTLAEHAEQLVGEARPSQVEPLHSQPQEPMSEPRMVHSLRFQNSQETVSNEVVDHIIARPQPGDLHEREKWCIPRLLKPSNKPVCRACCRSFKNMRGLSIHEYKCIESQKVSQKKSPVKPEVSNVPQASPDVLIRSIQSDSPGKPACVYQCHVCSVKFASRDNAIKHVRKHLHKQAVQTSN